MDFKGITWAGNIYDKFEAMCLEVEEVMYEDSITYVENQVQKVGMTVKKFYSEVMQDLLPPSCDELEPIKVAAGDLCLNLCAHTDINNTTRLSVLESQGELKKKETADEDNSDLTSEEFSLAVQNDQSYLSPISPAVVVENTHSRLCSVKSNKVGVDKRPIGIRRIPQISRPPRTSGLMNSLARDRSNMVSSETRNGCVVAADDMNLMRFSEFSVRCESKDKKPENMYTSDVSGESCVSEKLFPAKFPKHEKHDSKCTSPISDKISSAELLRRKKDDSEQTPSFHGFPSTIVPSIKDCSLSQSGSNCTSNAYVGSANQDAVMSTEDIMLNDGSFFQIYPNISSDRYNDASAGEEVVVSYEENFDMEVIDDEEIAESDDPSKNSKFEETCVLVEGDEVPPISQTNEKRKSYKKKICEALSSNLRSTRQCGSINKKNNAMESNCRNLQAPESFGSDWELL